MKRLLSIAAAALLAATAAHAQTYEPAVPRGIPESSAPQSRELGRPAPDPAMSPGAQSVDPAIPRLVMDRRRGHSDADARRCLDLGTNRQIHRCAERYRAHAAHAKVTRTKAAKPRETTAAAAAPASKAASDLGKADLSKAATPAKPVDTAKPAATPTPPPTTAAVIQKPAATPAPAAPEKAAPASGDKPLKWTDTAKGTMKSRGDRLPE